MFIFDASKITTKKEFDSFVDKESQSLARTREKLFSEYGLLRSVVLSGDIENYQKFRDEYKNLVHRILLEVIAHYRKYLPQQCLIAEFGSFVKRTERLTSDFDFTICYDEPKTEQYEVAEELIDYSLAEIFGYSIYHIHGKFQHYPDMPEVYYYTEKDNNYRLVFVDGVIDYKCGPETLNENLMNIKNVRDYHSMITGYEEKYKNKCNIDCLYSIEILENTTEHDFLGDLTDLEQKYDICDGYVFDLKPYGLREEFQISEIKTLLKNKGVLEFYVFVAKLRKKIGFCSTYSMDISDLWSNKIIISTFGEEYIYHLKREFISFIFFWNRIELSLTKRGIPLSTRCYKGFSIDSLNEILSEDWGKTTNIEMIVGARNTLTTTVQDGLQLLEEIV